MPRKVNIVSYINKQHIIFEVDNKLWLEKLTTHGLDHTHL